MMKQYGISNFKNSYSELDKHVENIKLKGYTIFQNLISEDNINYYKKSLEDVYKTQVAEFGAENLSLIQEIDVCRTPMAYDEKFLELVTNKSVLDLIVVLLGDNFNLHLQNGVINRNKKEHHQTSWHRDIPYQEYTVSSPISINVFYCLSPFNTTTGGTILLPYSQKSAFIPSVDFVESNQIQPDLNAGDVIVFDSWIYHKAGYNSSDIVRYGVNHVFTTPILKQQINLPKLFNGKYKDHDTLYKILGYAFDVPESVLDYREKRMQRLANKNKEN